MKTIIVNQEIEAAVQRMSDAEIAALFLALLHRARDEDEPQKTKRRRGGQPGNRNACRKTNKTNTETNKTNTETNKTNAQTNQTNEENEQEKEKNQKNKEEEKEVLLERVDKTAKRFVPPQLEEIRAFVFEKNYEIDPDVFYNYYEANGWRIGRTPMKNWRAAVAQWNAREKAQQPHPGPPRTGEGVLSYQHSNNNRYANNQTSTIFSHSTRSGGCSPSGNEGVGGSYRGGLRPTTAELTVQSAAQAIANLQHRRASPLADVLGW